MFPTLMIIREWNEPDEWNEEGSEVNGPVRSFIRLLFLRSRLPLNDTAKLTNQQ